ncbi:acyltransferase family protein [Microbacterium sp. ZW T5_56]|uniref:acyltransferase family protein n=1 Tax=Microbacterium sp. ZW T5_56 TaxID=3378081 RepID=UPI0038543419
MTTTHTPAQSRAEARERAARAFRLDVQALRAVAIAAVVANHFWPQQITGGYVGVDIFFVISGFLITSHLEREVVRDGRVRLGRFYARRIRRLLPAAGLVLILSAVGAFLFLPYPRWIDNGVQILASATYVENWVLAAQSINYSAHNAAASAVQHYWSLSVEEQFYLLWPVLFTMTAVAGARIWPRTSVRTRLWIVVLSVAAISLAGSIIYTEWSAPQAYFVTFTRAWQFAIGAVVALLAPRIRLARGPAGVLSGTGFVGLLFAIVVYSEHTPYPGTAALLPVIATALVIVAGTGQMTPLPVIGPVLAARPVQWLGDVSYSLYLWHWPLLVIVPLAVGVPLDGIVTVGIIALALVLAWVTRRLIEVPVQRWTWWAGSTRRAVRGMLAIILLVALAVTPLLIGGAVRTSAAADTTADGIPAADGCSGPAALMNPAAGCDAQIAVADPVVPPQAAYYALAPECGELDDRFAMDDRQTTRQCDFGAGTPGPRVWLVGDSHAEQWQSPLFELARAGGWDLTISSFAGCPVADVEFRGFREGWGAPDNERCMRWADELTSGIENERPDVVFTTMTMRQERADDGSGMSEFDQQVAGLERTWSRWADAGVLVIPIVDVPYNADVRPPECLLTSAATPIECARPRADALPHDPIIGAAAQRGLATINLTDAFCDADQCFAAVGGMPVYFDNDHMSATYARALEPWFRGAVQGILSAGGIDSAGL